ncbi:integrase core domain-containing protein [Lactococcus formosensis]|uniref:integrase core domain-containing protein n=1 Tax=Lactococcus formosensis TaxID=1281486 RepID=UPI003852A3EC
MSHFELVHQRINRYNEFGIAGLQRNRQRTANPYDNAMMESFYKTLKREIINEALFETRAEATQEIFKYIETYYNTKRMHSALDYKSQKYFEKYNS